VGLHDRQYWQEPGPTGGVFAGLPRPSSAVKLLLLANIAVFAAQLLLPILLRVDLAGSLGVTVGAFWQLWRYVSFQFLHDTGSLWHIVLNMLGLYMLGGPLEQRWGARRFAAFYLSCGVAAGLAYVVIGFLLGLPSNHPMIGASGGVYGVVLACAALFPHFRLVFFVFPVPIRLAAVILFGGMALMVLSSLGSGRAGPGFWSDVAHLGGAAAGAAWIWVLPRFATLRADLGRRFRRGAWERKMKRRQAEQAEIDGILAKVHERGVASLTEKDKRTLREATARKRHEIDG